MDSKKRPGKPSTRPSSLKPSHPAVEVKLSTGGGHPAIAAPITEYSRHRRRKAPTSQHERVRLRGEWEDLEWERVRLEARRRQLEAQWPEDVKRPPPERPSISTRQAIDWSVQPPIPAEQIDWSRQGEPLRVRPTLGAMIMAISMIVSILGAGAYFYWGIRMHLTDQRSHVPSDGVPWGVKSKYESKQSAKMARDELQHQIVKTMKVEHSQLKKDIVDGLRERRRRRR